MRQLRDFGRMAWLVLVVAAALAFAGAPGANAHQTNCGSVMTVAADGAHQHHHTRSGESTATKAAAVPCCTTACPICVSAAAPSAATPHVVAFLRLVYPERPSGLSGNKPLPDFEPPRLLA